MKILHTADLHLLNINDERWRALEEIIKKANSEKAQLLVISGDLFDSEEAMEKLRDKLRQLFEIAKFTTIIIPGNHDFQAYRKGLFFGKNVKIYTTNENIEVFNYENVKIILFPFEELNEEMIFEKLLKLNSKTSKEFLNILVFHGELIDSFYSRDSFGMESAEGQKRYLPVKLSYFEDLNFDYILAGHFHKNFNIYSFKNRNNREGFFIYPGSPVSITKKETDVRKVCLIDTELNDNLDNINNKNNVDNKRNDNNIIINLPEEVLLNTFTYFEKVINVSNDFDNLNDLFENINSTYSHFISINPDSKILLQLSGFINSDKLGITEAELHSKIIDYIKNYKNIILEAFEVKDISNIIENEIYKKVIEKIEQVDEFEETKKERLKRLLIKALSNTLYK